MTKVGALHRIGEQSAVVAILGLGYVGLPLADAFVSAGFDTLGVDIDHDLVDRLNRAPAGDQRTQIFDRLAASSLFQASTDSALLDRADAILVSVPTPLGAHEEPDLSFVVASASTIGAVMRPGQLIVLESTTFPGTTRTVFLDALVAASAQLTVEDVGQNFFVAYSPEREDPGRDVPATSVPKIVGGLDADSTEVALALYRKVFDEVFAVSNAEVAEAAKLLENIFRAVNIALVNELKTVLAALNIDVWEVIEAASTKPYGFMPFYPGPGLGGHCIPIDPFYLTWVAKEAGVTSNFIELAGVTNTRMPGYVVQQLIEALNDDERSVRGAKILILGLAYKRDIGDIRESPACQLLEQIDARGGVVSYHDPHVASYPNATLSTGQLDSIVLDAESVAAADAVLIATDHSAIDYGLLAEHARIIIDTRNVLHRRGLTPAGRLYKA